MSRHAITAKNPDLDLIIGFDPPLRHFFGQVFDRQAQANNDDLVAGWPTPLGLGVQPRVTTEAHAHQSLDELMKWAGFYANHPDSLVAYKALLLGEWAAAPNVVPRPLSLLLGAAKQL